MFLGGEERVGVLTLPGAAYLTEFRLDMGLPVWRYEVKEWTVEKRVLLPHGQNTVLISYRLTGGQGKRCDTSSGRRFISALMMLRFTRRDRRQILRGNGGE